MRQVAPPVWGPLLLAAAAVLSCLGYATGAVNVTRSEFTWTADRTGPAAPLVLAAQSPQTLTAGGDCSAGQGDLVQTGDPAATALTLKAGDGLIWMTYAGRLIGQPLDAGQDCTFELAYARAANTATLRVAAQATEAQLAPLTVGYDSPAYQQFAVTRLFASPGIEVKVVTQPTSYSSSPWRIVWLLICALSVVGLAVLLRRRYPVVPHESASAWWTRYDTVVAATAGLAMIVVPPRFDDGWVLTTVRQYADLGFFPNYYSIDATAQPQGFWWAWIERLWLSPLGTPGFLLRLPSALILVATWWLLRRQVLDRIAVGPPGRWAGVLIAAASAVGLQMTIRPEPVVALLLAAAIAVVVRYAQTEEPWLLVVLGGLSAMAMSVHQTGWSLALASLAVAPWLIPWLRRTRAYVAVLGVVVVSGASALLLAMLGSNWALWWSSLTAFRRDSSTYQGFLDEGLRIAALSTRFDLPSVTIAAVGLLGLAVVGFLLRSDRSKASSNAAGWASVAAVVGLALTSSKLIDHYGAVVPAGVVLGALAVTGVSRRVALGFGAALVALGVVALSSVGVWALGLERDTELQLGAWRTAAIALLVLIVAVLAWATARNSIAAGSAVMAMTWALVCIVVAASLGPVVTNGFSNRGSWFGQQLEVLQGRTCGLIDVVTMRAPQPSVFDNPVVSPTIEQTTPMRDPSIWVRGSLFGPIALDLVQSDGGSSPVLIPASPAVWRLVQASEMDAPVSVRWADPALAVVVAPGIPSVPARTVWDDSRSGWWVEPGLALQAPCVETASIRSGVIENVRHSVGAPGWSGAGLLANSPLTFEAGCADDAAGSGRCLVNLDPAPGSTLDGREIVERVS